MAGTEKTSPVNTGYFVAKEACDMRYVQYSIETWNRMQERRSKYASLTRTSPEDYDIEEFADDD
jgi:hypothetical protein